MFGTGRVVTSSGRASRYMKARWMFPKSTKLAASLYVMPLSLRTFCTKMELRSSYSPAISGFSA